MKAVIFDFNQTLREDKKEELLPHALEVLKYLKGRGYWLYLLSRKEGDRAALLSRLGIEHFFEKVFFVEDKTPETFNDVLRHLPPSIEKIYVIGDHRHKEIRLGNQFGLTTIWLKRGKFADLPEISAFDVPWKTIEDLSEIPALL